MPILLVSIWPFCEKYFDAQRFLGEIMHPAERNIGVV
jgi:hypothetical protein